MKSKIQIVILMTALLGASGISWDGGQASGKQGSRINRLPINLPHDIIGPTCPGTTACAR